MRLAAIDIGSNAVRLLIEEIVEANNEYHIHKVSLTRVPLRLGEDVFAVKKIGKEKTLALVNTMKAFWYLMQVHDVQHFRACATSAMREAENKESVLKLVKKEANIPIEIISGSEEADLIFGNFEVSGLSNLKNYLYIDVGGGSTELTIIHKGKRVNAISLPVGTVRLLKTKVPESSWNKVEKWLKENALPEKGLIGIGTGGNINRIHKECGKKTGQALSLPEISEYREHVASYEMEDRIVKLKLKPDRADVIVPAADIYIRVMQTAGIKELQVPKVGLSDGIVLDLYHLWRNGKLK